MRNLQVTGQCWDWNTRQTACAGCSSLQRSPARWRARIPAQSAALSGPRACAWSGGGQATATMRVFHSLFAVGDHVPEMGFAVQKRRSMICRLSLFVICWWLIATDKRKPTSKHWVNGKSMSFWAHCSGTNSTCELAENAVDERNSRGKFFKKTSPKNKGDAKISHILKKYDHNTPARSVLLRNGVAAMFPTARANLAIFVCVWKDVKYDFCITFFFWESLMIFFPLPNLVGRSPKHVIAVLIVTLKHFAIIFLKKIELIDRFEFTKSHTHTHTHTHTQSQSRTHPPTPSSLPHLSGLKNSNSSGDAPRPAAISELR